MLFNLFDRKYQNVITVDFPFTSYPDMKNYFSRNGETVTENGKEKPRLDVFPDKASVFALVTMKSGLHSIVSKQGTAKEEPRNQTGNPGTGTPEPGTLRLYGYVPYNGKNLDELNRNPGTGENRTVEDMIATSRDTNRKKLETALKEIDSILFGVNRLARNYEYFRGMDIEDYIENYIRSRLATCSHDTQDIFSETKTAIYSEPGTPEQKQKAGYKALHHYVYSFKKTETMFCLDDETKTLSLERILQGMTGEQGKRNPELLKALKDCFKYFSEPERKTIIMLSYGYNLSDVARMTGKNVGTIKTYQTKAQTKICKLIPEIVERFTLPGTINEVKRKEEREQEKHRVRQANYKARQKAKREQERKNPVKV